MGMLMSKVMCPQAAMTPVWANMTAHAPPEYRCVKCGATGHAKWEARGRVAAALMIEEASKPKKRKFKKGGKSKKKKG